VTNIGKDQWNIAIASREITDDEKIKFWNNFMQFDIGLDGVVIAISKLNL